MRRPRRRAPRLYAVTTTGVVATLATLAAEGKLPLSTSGPRGGEHVIFGCAIVGLVIGGRLGWPRDR
jgi:hypothetical protein